MSELDKLIENLWGRALDMTSPDFADDVDYKKAQNNYKKSCAQELKALIDNEVAKARITALTDAKLRLVVAKGNAEYVVDLDKEIATLQTNLGEGEN